MRHNFKVGDRVRCIVDSYDYDAHAKVGEELIVTYLIGDNGIGFLNGFSSEKLSAATNVNDCFSLSRRIPEVRSPNEFTEILNTHGVPIWNSTDFELVESTTK